MMTKILLGMACVLLSTTLAWADGDDACVSANDDNAAPYLCDVPGSAAFGPRNPRCAGPVKGKLLCDGKLGVEIRRPPVKNVTTPSNCGKNRRGHYVCW